MRKQQVDSLDPHREWWAVAVEAPERDWPAAPGCRRGARFLLKAETLSPSRDEFDPFESRLACLQWIMAHRLELAQALPGAAAHPVRLDRWLLGLE